MQPIEIPDELARLIDAVKNTGRPYVVGGSVRDWLLGQTPHDFDIEVFGTDYEELRNVLAKFGPTEVVGKSFGVVKVRIGENEYDFALPRRERKTGSGHRGFEVEPDPSLTLAEAAARRDFTINAIAWDPLSGEFIDPTGGRADLERKCLRHVGPAFSEDPLRVLRGFQLASRFDLTMAPETIELCRSIHATFAELPTERIWHEWEKWAAQSIVPSRGIEVLEATGWIEHFPQLAALKDCPQDPEWHPEGDVLTHTKLCLDSLVRIPAWQKASRNHRALLTFAVLIHDFGKAVTTEVAEKRGRLRTISPGHDKAGAEMVGPFLDSIGAPKAFAKFIRPLVRNHMIHIHAADSLKPATVRRLAARLSPATIEDLAILMTADLRGRKPNDFSKHPLVDTLLETAREMEIEKNAPKPLILGRDLIDHGLEPGPHFGKILKKLFEAQLEGDFTDKEEGLAYLDELLRERNEEND